MVYVVLMKTLSNGRAVELRDACAVEHTHLTMMAEIARDEGFDMMFQFSCKPDMAEVTRRARHEGEGISQMPFMKKLWVLNPEAIK